jgi:hypothetical protein
VPAFVNYLKGCTRLTTANDKVYQLLAHGQWFSPSTPASSTTKTGRHDIAEILLKVVYVILFFVFGSKGYLYKIYQIFFKTILKIPKGY